MKKSLLLAAGIALSGMASAQIFSEDFEGGAIPAGWGTSSADATSTGWAVGTTASLGSQFFSLAGNSTQFAATNDDGCNACNKSDDFLWTSDVDLTANAGQTLHLKYKQFYFDASYQGAQEEAFIKYSTDGGNTWMDLYKLPGAGGWAENIIDISSIAGMNVKLGFHYNDGGGWTYGCGIDDISIYQAADEDVILTSLDMPNYSKLGVAVDVNGNVFNAAGVAITSLDVEYTVNGGTPVSGTISGLNIAPLTSGSFTHPTSWTPSAEGTFAFNVTITGINGSIDADISDNSGTHEVIAYANSYDRVVLYETFTSSTCGPCVAGNANFEAVKATIPAEQYASIKYQMSWPGAGDPYNTADGNDRRGYYGINSVPAMQVDGGWNGNSGSFTKAVHDDALEVPAFVSIWAQYHVNVADQKVTTCATISAMQDMGDATLQVAIKEFDTYNNVGSNGETEFKDVVKKMAPTSSGQTVTITAGMSQEVCVDYTFNGTYRLPADASDLINDATEHSVEEFEDLGVVVWLQNDADMVVLNSTNAISAPLSVEEVANVSTVSLFPNPANNNTTLSIVAEESSQAVVTVYDMAGRTIKVINTTLVNGNNNVEINTNDYNNGVYFVEVSSNNQTVTERLVIQK